MFIVLHAVRCLDIKTGGPLEVLFPDKEDAEAYAQSWGEEGILPLEAREIKVFIEA